MVESLAIEFLGAQGVNLAGRLELPAEPRAFAVFAHCFTCSKDSPAASRISRALGKRGIAVLRFDFTGLGGSEGDFGNSNFSSNLGDLRAAADWLRENYQAPHLMIGHSLGGAAVLRVAGDIPELRAVATIGAPAEAEHVRHLFRADLEAIETEGRATVELAGRPFEIDKQFIEDLEEQKVLADLKRLRIAKLIAHAPTDDTVGIGNAQKIYQALQHPKSFFSLDGADHLLSRREDAAYFADVLTAWVSRYVGEGVTSAPEPFVAHGEVYVEQSAGGFKTEITAGSHRYVADEPKRVGGTDLGPNPYDYLLSALGACTSMTLHMYAKHKKWPLDGVRVRLQHDRIHVADCEHCVSASGKVDRIQRELELDGKLDEGQRARLLEIADRCPVHRTLENEKIITTVLRGGD